MKKRRLISLFLAIAMVISMLPIMASADEATQAATDGYVTITDRTGWTGGATVATDYQLEAGKSYTLMLDLKVINPSPNGNPDGIRSGIRATATSTSNLY